MTKTEKHRRDLEYLLTMEEPDMSPEAIWYRLQKLGELCQLAQLLQLPDLEYFVADYHWSPNRDN